MSKTEVQEALVREKEAAETKKEEAEAKLAAEKRYRGWLAHEAQGARRDRGGLPRHAAPVGGAARGRGF